MMYHKGLIDWLASYSMDPETHVSGLAYRQRGGAGDRGIEGWGRGAVLTGQCHYRDLTCSRSQGITTRSSKMGSSSAMLLSMHAIRLVSASSHHLLKSLALRSPRQYCITISGTFTPCFFASHADAASLAASHRCLRSPSEQQIFVCF